MRAMLGPLAALLVALGGCAVDDSTFECRVTYECDQPHQMLTVAVCAGDRDEADDLARDAGWNACGGWRTSRYVIVSCTRTLEICSD